MRAVVMLMLISASVAPPIRWINRCPAVMLAVSRTARATGWIKRLIVSIITSIGINGVGVPCGRKWASDALVLLRKPVTTAPAHRGMAMPRFIDSCVVGVNEWGSRPSRFVDPINKIKDISINVHVCPLVLWILIICFDTSWSIHCWRETRRLLTSRFGVGNSKLGNSTIRVTRGRPRFSFKKQSQKLRPHWDSRGKSIPCLFQLLEDAYILWLLATSLQPLCASSYLFLWLWSPCLALIRGLHWAHLNPG